MDVTRQFNRLRRLQNNAPHPVFFTQSHIKISGFDGEGFYYRRLDFFGKFVGSSIYSEQLSRLFCISFAGEPVLRNTWVSLPPKIPPHAI